ncbi:MAG: hypothetical protein IJG94_09250 [Clostridia bacterium]|nr:hypothetical protein [Clostridia bacterium]
MQQMGKRCQVFRPEAAQLNDGALLAAAKRANRIRTVFLPIQFHPLSATGIDTAGFPMITKAFVFHGILLHFPSSFLPCWQYFNRRENSNPLLRPASGKAFSRTSSMRSRFFRRTLLPMADSRIFPSLSEKPNAASISAPAPLRTACEEPFAFPDTNLICTFPFSPFREANPEKKSRLSFHGPCACLFVYRVFAFRQRQLITAMLSYHGKKLRTLTSFPESKTGNTK